MFAVCCTHTSHGRHTWIYSSLWALRLENRERRHSRRASAVQISSDHGPGLCIKSLNQQYGWHNVPSRGCRWTQHTYAACQARATDSTSMAQMHVVSHQAAQHHGVAASEACRGTIRPETSLHEDVLWFSMHSCSTARHIEEIYSAGRSACHNTLTAVLITSLMDVIQEPTLFLA